MIIIDWILTIMLVLAAITAFGVFAIAYADWKHLRRMRALQKNHDLRVEK